MRVFPIRGCPRHGRLAQLVRALPSHGRGQRFKSFIAHHFLLIRQQDVILAEIPCLSVFRTIEFLGLSMWLGSDVFLSFVVAPGAFRCLQPGSGWGDRGVCAYADALDWDCLWHCVFAGASVAHSEFAGLVAPAALCVVVMIVLTAVSQVGGQSRGWRCCGCRWGPFRRRRQIVHCWRSSADCIDFGIAGEAASYWRDLAAMYLMVRELAAETDWHRS